MISRPAWAAVILSCAFVTMAFSGERSNGPPRTVVGPVDNAATWEGELLLEGTVSVKEDARLTILPGTRIRFSKGAELLIAGRLEAAGTSGQPIRFESGAPAPSRGDWRGITLVGQGDGSTLKGCIVTDAESVRIGAGNPLVSGCTIERGTTGILVGKDAAGRLSGNRISDMSDHGIECQMGASPAIDNNDIQRCGKAGILSQRNAMPTVTGNRISECNAGIHYAASAPTPERNRLERNTVGIAVNGAEGGMGISRNRFAGNAFGLRIENFSAPRVEGNVFDNNGVGIFCFRSSSPEIVHNLIVRNREGIACSQMSAPSIRANEIAGNETGIELTLSSYAVVNGNNLEKNAVQLKLDNMSHDWEVKTGRKPERGSRARSHGRAERGAGNTAPAPALGNEDSVGEDFVDATGNWWGEKDTAEMAAKGADANIGSLVDAYDVPTRTYEGYEGEYAQDRIRYAGWKNGRIPDAGLRDGEREN